jgi:beta-glucosidase
MSTIDVKKLLSELTLEEKAGLCSGADFWHTKAVERLGIPQVMVSDGPHGLRKQDIKEDHLGLGGSVKAVCFPAASALACSFDRDLLYQLGTALGDECQAEEVSTILGPAVNMKRSPLCGRNFEYFSEDPYLAGELAAGYVNGVQSKNIGTSVKHFAANNQETRRLSISAEVDERTLREIYLAAFETIVKKAQPWTMMCSYNLINGTYSCENDWLLTKVLREEWGFDGLVVTDWGAMNDRVKALQSGLDLEMPSSHGVTDKEIAAAVLDGRLSMEALDKAVARILELVKKSVEGKRYGASYDKEEHHALARRMAEEGAVLLKNESILPLKEDSKVAFIGEFASAPRYQGGGSSHINSFKVTSALDASKGLHITYAKGYDTLKDELDEDRLEEAISHAKEAEAAVVFAGLPDAYESEGYDRTHLNLPACQNTLIEEILKVQPNTVVVLYNGSPVLMPWADKVKGILEVYLGGQAVGEATVHLLYGKANPSGKLAETFPLRLQDNPSYYNFPGTSRTVSYMEGIFIGYRYYDAKEMEVLYPFGYGLSYTTFTYRNLKMQVLKAEAGGENIRAEGEHTSGTNLVHMTDADQLQVTVMVKNTGSCFGKEIVQLYVQDKEASVIRPLKELKGFEKVALEPGEEKEVTFTLDSRSFAFYSTERSDWYAESGEYQILIGKSSRNIVLSGTVHMEYTKPEPFHFDDRTTLGDVLPLMKDPSVLFDRIKGALGAAATEESDTAEAKMMAEMVKTMPLHSLRSFSPTPVSAEDLENLKQLILSQLK